MRVGDDDGNGDGNSDGDGNIDTNTKQWQHQLVAVNETTTASISTS